MHFLKQNISLILIALLILVGVLFFFVFRMRSPYTIRQGAAVIKELKALNRYETASFTIEKVIDAGTKNDRLRELLFGDRILLIAHGEVIAGFDLSTLQGNDIDVNGQTVRLTLPKPQILVTRLDSDQTRVYDRQQGLLTRGDKDLESVARQEAEKSIRDAACAGNILKSASDNGRSQLTALLKALGFTTVVIEIPQASC